MTARPSSRPLRLFVTGQAVNALGSAVSSVVLPLVAVDRLHASTLVVGGLEALEWAPAVLLGLPVGALVDRRQSRARTVMMVANLGQATALSLVPASAAAGALSVRVLMVAAVAAGLCTVPFQAGYAPYLRTLIDGEDYLRANAQVRGAQSAAMLVGPAVSGALVEAIGSPTAVLSDAVSFLVSFASLAALRGQRVPAPAAGPTPPLVVQVKAGLAHLWGDPLLRALTWATASVNLFLTAIGALEVVFLVRQVHASARWVGLLLAFGAAGGVVGSLVAGRVSRRAGLRAVARASVAATAPATLLMPLTSHGAGMIFFAIAGPPANLGIALVSVSFQTLRLEHCPPRLQARVSSASRAVTALTIPAGALLGGTLGQFFGNRVGLLVLASAYSALGLVLLFGPSLGPAPAGDSDNSTGA